jgi:hypothetical protein
MSIKYGIVSEDVDRQIALLKLYPEIAEANYRPAMEESVDLAAASIVSGIPVRTGYAIEHFGTRVTGKGLNLTGEVGWWGKHSAWYINIVEAGAMAHPVESGVSIRGSHARQRLFNAALKSGAIAENPGGQHVKINGEWKTMKSHPGFPGRHFMKSGFEAVQPAIDIVFAAANDAVARELALP